jgi:hypothetical protein
VRKRSQSAKRSLRDSPRIGTLVIEHELKGAFFMWRKLTEDYARRARELSDAVAHLGKHVEIRPDTLNLLTEIEEKQVLCTKAGDEVKRYAKEHGRSLSAAAAGSDHCY